LDGLLGRGPGRDHQPSDSRGAQFGDEIVERRRTDRTLTGNMLHVVGAEIGHNYLVSATQQAPRHIRTHSA
jgi:hypothetical protein